jgi:hypothetical protein
MRHLLYFLASILTHKVSSYFVLSPSIDTLRVVNWEMANSPHTYGHILISEE